jgi:beta-glucanase (GH16 family)
LRIGARRRTFPLIGVTCLAALVSACTPTLTAGGASLTASDPPWVRVWYAGFGGPSGSGVNTQYWKYDTGTGVFGNGEVETMTDSPGNVHLNGSGDLDITALHQNGSWTSGRIQTLRLFGAPAGGEMKVTASIEQPNPAHGLGYWPAFWMLGLGSWPEHGEIDMLEDVNGLSEHSGAFHCGNLTHLNSDGTYGPCHEHTGLSSRLRPCPRCQVSFQSYSVIVDRRNPAAEQIRWYLNGRQFFQVSENAVGSSVWDEAVNHGFSIILDLAIGGQYPDEICDCVTPTSQTSSGGTMQVQSVAVYQN